MNSVKYGSIDYISSQEDTLVTDVSNIKTFMNSCFGGSWSLTNSFNWTYFPVISLKKW